MNGGAEWLNDFPLSNYYLRDRAKIGTQVLGATPTHISNGSCEDKHLRHTLRKLVGHLLNG